MKKLLSVILCCLILTGCCEKPAETTLQTEETFPSNMQEETTEPVIYREIDYALEIYIPDENAEHFETILTKVGDLEADTVLNALIEYSMLNEGIILNKMELVDSQLNLDFNQVFLDQLMTYGTAGEQMMIGCVVNTFLGVFKAETVYITVNGEILESGHVIYDFPMSFFE